MKEIYMLAGIGVGMVAGIMLYKYCDSAKKVVDNTEKKIMKKADEMEKDTKKKIDGVKKNIKKKTKQNA